MLKSLSFLSMAGVLCVASACVVNNDDDDDGSNVTTGPSDTMTTSNTTTTTTSTTSTTSTTTTPDDTGDTTADTGDSTATGDGSTTEAQDSTATDTGEPAGCGWGKIKGQPNVDMGYICGGDGPDPEDDFPLECPANTTLEEGGECGMIRAQGCCDEEGNLWYCGMIDDGDPMLFTEEC